MTPAVKHAPNYTRKRPFNSNACVRACVTAAATVGGGSSAAGIDTERQFALTSLPASLTLSLFLRFCFLPLGR